MPSEEVTGCEYLKPYGSIRLTSPFYMMMIKIPLLLRLGEVELTTKHNHLFFASWHLTNLIVFGVRLRSASKVAGGAYGPGNRSRRDDTLGPHGWC